MSKPNNKKSETATIAQETIDECSFYKLPKDTIA